MNRSISGTVLAASLGFGLVQLDVSIVNVAFLSIARSLRADTADASWIVNAYTIAFASLLLAAGALGDRIGSKRIFITGFAIFAAASLGCALAPSLRVLIAMRACQGLGASTLVPCSLALIAHATQGNAPKRAHAIALWTAAGSAALAVGPLAGGALVATCGWRAIFLVNLPICAIAIALARRTLTETPTLARQFDPLAQLLVIMTLVCATAGITEGGAIGFDSTIARIAFTGCVLSACALVYVEHHRREPLVPLDFFRKPTLRAALTVGFAINASLYGTLFMLAVYLQKQGHYAPLTVGLAFVPFAIALGGANVAAGWLVARHGPRIPMIAGLALALTGFTSLLLIDHAVAYRTILPALLLIPCGIGVAVPAMTSALMGSVSPASAGVASGVLNTVRQAAGALGVAAAAAFMTRPDVVAGLHAAAVLWLLAIGVGISAAAVGIGRAPRSNAA